MRLGSGFTVFLVVVVVLVGFGLLLWVNAQPTPALRAIVPTEVQPTEDSNAWQDILKKGFADSGTVLPTIAIPPQQFAAPTLMPVNDAAGTPFEAADLGNSGTLGPVAVAATPTRPVVTSPTNIAVTNVPVTRSPSEWLPPPLIPPISRDPLGRDHYWFVRPVDSSANNKVLFYYPYGSDGPQKDNTLRIHTGVDMPNPIGEAVRAAGPGIVRWAGSNFQNSSSYGNVVFIEHDFGYRGQPIWTLYAHLSATLVAVGQHVNTGDVIGLVGGTGRVSGPHVHFEVRMGQDRYGSTYNPVLWMVPYVGTGVIAGRVLNQNGQLLQDIDITVRSRSTGLVQDTTTTYTYANTVNDVNADPIWGESFVVGDVPAGRYEVIANVAGYLISEIVTVVEGTTTFVELKPPAPAASQPAPSS